ncbi:hypothetical protein AB6A40_008926 [Gnathostoma spinigerum]|uniref:GST C-terminal domain-containing protein n=1 Tax=Gnathostoma spinigerum TaxID=75299 RepID=A0ABD6EZK7_9BILA
MAAELTKAESLLMFAFFAGDNPGFADYFAYPFYRLLSMYPYINGSVVKDDDYPNDKLYPKVAKWLTAMSELSEVAACVQPQENVLKFLEDSFGGNQNYDTGL